MADGLFDMRPVPRPPEQATRAARRRERHRQQFAAGWHPLSWSLRAGLKLHAEAAPLADRKAAGRRCGSCRFREQLRQETARPFPKCTAGGGTRATHSEASDVRAWWPACIDHEYADPAVGPDAARWVPPMEGDHR